MHPSEDSDSWTRTLLARPAIEVRRGFSFGSDPPVERSSVLVLTAPSGRYVDVRFPKGVVPAGAFSMPRSPAAISCGFVGFATAGMSHARVVPGQDGCPGYDCSAVVLWKHPIDSSGRFGEDEAYMFLLGNGDVMEVGTMEDAGGKVRMFKEYWTGPPGGTASHVGTSFPCVVAEIKRDDTNPVMGVAIRVGNHCQGILQSETEFWVERWEKNDPQGDWALDTRGNSVGRFAVDKNSLPVPWLLQDKRAVGDEVISGGNTWVIVEAVET